MGIGPDATSDGGTMNNDTAHGRSGTHIHLDACAKTFPDGTRALIPTSLDIAPGEIMVLLGPSGCGKTTLLRIVAGLETTDTGGRVLFDRDNVTDVPIERREVGMVFQSYALFPNMTVRGNIGYGLKVRRIARDQVASRVDDVLTLCQLSDLADRPVSALSGGQRQRVALARAVAPRPRVLLLDEPLSALDAALRDHLRSELAALLRQFNTTAIFVTHDQSEAMAIADRIAVMRTGTICQIDTPEALYRTPADNYVAEFVGGANRFDGHPEGTDRSACLLLAGGILNLPRPMPAGHAVYARPEAIQITEAEGAPLAGRVCGVIFQGTHYRITVDGVTDRAITVDHAGGQSPRIGEMVGLAIDPEAVLILPDTASAGAASARVPRTGFQPGSGSTAGSRSR